jgi:HSP20 family protein
LAPAIPFIVTFSCTVLLREGVSLSKRWWRRRRKKRPWFNDFRDEFDRLEGMTDKIMRKAFETASERTKVRRPYVYGFSMSVGPDGKPVIRDFGNVQPSRGGPKIRKEREPLIDVIEEDGSVVIIAELPGVEKDDINLHAMEDHLTVSVNTHNQKYHKELTLPATVDPKSAWASYKNGVLKVKLKKLEKAVEVERISVK